ncbi:MAG: tRNA (N6-threonylcarbamoyladenosine(37)-N6)-methyltransferase TrmO [Holophaga sp.]|nr:tRNA (N6-threonylcarbamoyladenosine(37)-N6)-methyltransferase TrmO [Holophaga sp.]
MSLNLQPLGLIHTPHRAPDQTPIQPCFAEGIQGEIHLDPAFAEGLEGLEAFSHAFLIYHLHCAEPGPLRVKPFLLDEVKGVFACRYPHRPNSLGLSLVQLVAINGTTVVFEGADMLDGTPLLDIKPYYPKADRPEAAWGGWTEQLDPEEARRIGSRQMGVPLHPEDQIINPARG